MRIGSLCSGIGGIELGVERATGARTVWHAEVDPHASAVLARHWPGVPNLGDLTAVDWAGVEPVDVLTAGYPCQPFSHAGLRQGEDDDRHLWPAVRDAVGVLRPRFVLLENVRGHLSLGFGRVLGDLADLGFDAEWQVLRSSDVGAPHRRERVFIAASDADGEPLGAQPFGERGSGDQVVAGLDRQAAADADGGRLEGCPQRDGEPEGQEGHHVIGMDADRRGPWGAYRPAVERWERLTRPAPLLTDDRGRLSPPFVEWMLGYPEDWVDGLGRTAALRCLGNSVQPQVSELAARLLLVPMLDGVAA